MVKIRLARQYQMSVSWALVTWVFILYHSFNNMHVYI